MNTALVIFGRFTLVLMGISGHQQLVGIGGDGETIVFVYGNHQRSTQTQVGGDKLAVGIFAHSNLATNIRYIHTDTQLAFALSDINVVLVVHAEVGSKSRTWSSIVGVAVS